MDQIDIDQIIEVPDTPDRLAKHGSNGRNGVKTENHISPLLRHGEKMFPEEGSRDQPMIIDCGNREMSLHPLEHPSNPKNSQGPRTSASFSTAISSPPKNPSLYRKRATEKKPSYLTHDSRHKHLESAKSSYTSKSFSSSHDDDILDLTEWSLNERGCGNRAVPGNSRASFQKRSGLPGTSSSDDPSNLAKTSCYGNGEKNNLRRGSVSFPLGERQGFDGTNGRKPENGVLPPNPVMAPRVNMQKRLVRNGCISPNNIAKTKQLDGKDINSSVAIEHSTGSMTSHPPPVSIDIRDLVAEDDDSHSRKGKEVISHPCFSRRPGLETSYLHGGSSVSPSKKAVESVDYSGNGGKSVEELTGWRSIRNRTREMNNILSPDNQINLIRERATAQPIMQQHENRLDRRGKGVRVANCDDFAEDPSVISSKCFHAQSVNESVSCSQGRLGRLNGPRSAAAATLTKRQKQGSGLSSYGECSRSSDDREVILLSSPAEAAKLRSASSNASMPQIFDIIESSPQMTRDIHDEDARARQVEADELMALELQEQFYSESPAFGVQEADENIALALQHQDGLERGRSRGRLPVRNTSLISNLQRQPRSRSSSNASRRGPVAQSSSSGRMARLRGSFRGEPRTLASSQWRPSMFPPDMDIDMRISILGALEEFSAVGTSAGILNGITSRDFNENDYDMLLALDDNVDRAGASGRQINGLPQSTVQSDHEEACAVCLETPTVGDTIRHLPCLHKFHKDCIDPWLRRKTSCPVCKSSIT